MASQQDVDNIISDLLRHQDNCYNGTVIHFVRTKKRMPLKGRKRSTPYKVIASELCAEFSQNEEEIDFKKLCSTIRIVSKYYIFAVKNVERNWTDIIHFLNEIFEFPRVVGISQEEPNITPPGHVIDSTDKILTPVKTRQDCDNCISTKKKIVALNSSVKRQKGRIHKIKKTAAALKREWKVKSKNQKLKRYEEKIGELRGVVKNCDIRLNNLQKKNAKLCSTVDELERTKRVLNLENSKLKSDVETLRTSMKLNIKEMNAIKKNSDYITSINNELQEELKEVEFISSRSGKPYNERVRLCIYHELICNVPVSSCGFILNKVLYTMDRKQLTSVPSQSTCAQMAYELGVISTIQLMEFMLDQKSLCLSWDATSITGAHVNEIHLTANKVQCLVLDVRHLPGGKGVDYISHITSALADAAATYARYVSRPEPEVLNSLHSLISCTLSDRAAVNAVVTRQLCNELESDLLQLNCNVHPLDSIARDVKRDLVAFDRQHEIEGQCFGVEGAAANLIKAISILRYKDGKGDPAGFMNFLRQEDIPLGSFPRYVGNRLHVLFHLAGIVLHHHSKLIEFVEKQCTAAGLLRSKLLKDLRNTKVMVEVWALAVLGKTVTGPWMTKFYSSTMSNLEMGPLVRHCVTQMEEWIAEPSRLLHIHKNVFGGDLDSTDAVISSILLFDSSDDVLQLKAIGCVMGSALRVVVRQLHEFIDGRFLEPSADMMEHAASAPTHNMSSERALGSFDRLWRRAPNATLGFLNGKTRSKLNKTMEWLEGKDDVEKLNIIRFAIREAQSDRASKTLAQKRVFDNLSSRREDVMRQREKTARNAVVRELKLAFTETDPVLSKAYPMDAISRITDYVNQPESVIGTLVIHTTVNGQRYARVQAVKKDKLVISYWGFDDSEAISIDHSVPASAFYADVVLGSVLFL